MSQAVSDRVRALYDQVITACAGHDAVLAGRALLDLIALLDYEGAGTTAQGFHRLYEYCLRQVEKREFERVAWILGGLHAAWGEPLGTSNPLASRAAGGQPMRSA
jgi:hypothetical protein